MKNRFLPVALFAAICVLLCIPAQAANDAETVLDTYDYVGAFSEGIVRVGRKGADGNVKWGYVDKTGVEITPCVYDGAGYFSEGFAVVKQNDKWGFVDKTGRQAVPCMYDDVSPFSGGVARVELDGKLGFINKVGTVVVPCVYDASWPFSINFTQAEQSGDDDAAAAKGVRLNLNGGTGIGRLWVSGGGTVSAPADGNGGEVSFVKPHDPGDAIGLAWDWSAGRGVIITTR